MADPFFEDSLDPSTRPRRSRFTRTRPMFPEGLLSPILLVAMVIIAGLCVEDSSWSRILIPMALVAGVGAAAGCALAKIRIPDSVAHLVSTVVGLSLVVFLLERASELPGGFRENVRLVGSAGVDWYLGATIDRQFESLLVSAIMGWIIWLIGYLAGWLMFRFYLVAAAIVLPGFLLLVNLGYSEDPEVWYLIAFSGMALILIGRNYWFQRLGQWSRAGIGSPTAMRSGFVLSVTAMALVAIVAAATAPPTLSQSTFQPLMSDVSHRVLSAQDRVADWIEGSQDPLSTSEALDAGSFSAFDDAFSIGGPLNLTDEPQVLVAADYPPYLAAQSFDAYSGRGWYTTTEESFESLGADGRRYSPEMTFAANQRVPVTEDVSEDRSVNAIEVTPLTPTNGRLYTVDAYQTSNLEASVRMSWVKLDNVAFDLRSDEIESIPQDLRGFASLLMGSTLDGPATEFGPAAGNPETQATIELEHDPLQARFLNVSWTADDRGQVETMTVSGQAPVYDDVEAVFARQAAEAEESYRVLAATSTAGSATLSNASENYPDWVVDRYLSVPESVTPRTHDLALQLTADAQSPFDQAKAIEAYIRTNMVYDETVDAPPDGVDIVDYLLFERNRGYCEYSASAMTVMLRTLSVPARVVVGYYPGDYDADREGYLYLQSNAHSWTEVFFPGYGWIPFEPTPSQPLMEPGDQGAGESEEPVPFPTMAVEDITPEPTAPQSATEPEASPASEDLPVLPQVTPDDGSGGGRTFWTVLSVAGGLATLGGIVAISWFAPLRGTSGASALFLRLRRTGSWLGVAASPTATPREYGRAFVRQAPQTRGHVERIVKTYEVDQYGPERADSGWLSGAETAWSEIRRQIVRWPIRGWFTRRSGKDS